MTRVAVCNWYLSSHGCDLPAGHDGEHRCMHFAEEDGYWPTRLCFEWEPGHQYEFQGATIWREAES